MTLQFFIYNNNFAIFFLSNNKTMQFQQFLIPIAIVLAALIVRPTTPTNLNREGMSC